MMKTWLIPLLLILSPAAVPVILKRSGSYEHSHLYAISTLTRAADRP